MLVKYLSAENLRSPGSRKNSYIQRKDTAEAMRPVSRGDAGGMVIELTSTAGVKQLQQRFTGQEQRGFSLEPRGEIADIRRKYREELKKSNPRNK